jgi:hypothetical protein
MRNRNEPDHSPVQEAFNGLAPFIPEGEYLSRSELIKRVDREPEKNVRRDSKLIAHCFKFTRATKTRDGFVMYE